MCFFELVVKLLSSQLLFAAVEEQKRLLRKVARFNHTTVCNFFTAAGEALEKALVGS